MKLVFVVAQYGAEIVHGPEYACRLLAEQLSLRHDVDVLTTCARGKGPWHNEYTEGTDRIQGVLVRRFGVSAHSNGGPPASLTARQLAGGKHARADEDAWVAQQGPVSPGLVEFLKRQQSHYDAIAFFSCRHAATIQAMAAVTGRSVLFPWLTVDPSLRLGAVRKTMAAASVIGLMSSAEGPLLEAYGGRTATDDQVVGIGIQPPPRLRYPRIQPEAMTADETSDEAPVVEDAWAVPHLSGRGVPFRRRHRLGGRLVAYGEVTGPGQGCEEMLDYFDSYATEGGEGTLTLFGPSLMKVPPAPYLHQAGVLPARERIAAYEAAEVTLAPRGDDLTSQSVLESFAAGTPVLVSAANVAAVDHCRKSGGGLYYANREEFVGALTKLMTDAELRTKLGEGGQRYVLQNFNWEVVIDRLERLFTAARTR
jgi:hypothetical protein